MRYIPDPVRSGMAEADVELDGDHPSDLRQALTALAMLTRYTQTPDECFVCVWEGYASSCLDLELVKGPLVSLPHRRYALFTGAVTELENWFERLDGSGICAPPAFVWPADHRWCFTSDVDPHFAGVGASSAAVESLMMTPGIDVVSTSPEETTLRYDR